MDYITIHNWLPLKKETRQKLREIFFIPSTGMVEVVTDEFGKASVIKDGFTNVDLQVITAEKLVDYLGTAAINETIYDLWKRAVERVENPVVELETTIRKGEVVSQKVNGVEILPMNTADSQLRCDKCPFKTGSERGLKIHNVKHTRVKVA